MTCPTSNTQDLREMLLLLLATAEPQDPEVIEWVHSLDDLQLAESIAIAEGVQVATLAALRAAGDATHIH
jgi:hypothetical protein